MKCLGSYFTLSFLEGHSLLDVQIHLVQVPHAQIPLGDMAI